MDEQHLDLYRTARSNLAALDDTLPAASLVDYSSVLLELDDLHGDQRFPATVPVEVVDRESMFTTARDAMDQLGDYGVDLLGLELCIAALESAWETDKATGGRGRAEIA
ncbi:hypothetical protein [Luteimicrobium sp. DT211]|uniref:hypothetical protein n=1 Tax=Luteimicrobium sp. DT211 TaxID=3393412 RepID=UPI003CE8306D